MMRRLTWSLLLLALLLGATLPAVAEHGHEGGEKRREKEPAGEREGRDDDADEGGDGKDRHGEDGEDEGDEGRREGDGEGQKGHKAGDREDRRGQRGPRTGEAREGGAVKIPDVPLVQLRQDVDADGGAATYTVAVRNAGRADAPAVALAADLPAGSWTSPDPACAILGDRLTCDLGRLAPGEERVVEAHGTADAALFPAVVQAITPLAGGGPSSP